MPPRSRTLLWSVYGLLGLLLLVYCITLIVRSAGSYSPWLDGFLVCSVELVACALCFGRALTYRPGRAVALVLGVSLLSWTVGDIVLTIESLGGVTPSSPSLADAFYLGFYPFCYVAVMLFMRRELRKHAAPNWLDGAIAGVGRGGGLRGVRLPLDPGRDGRQPDGDDDDLAYPIGDLLLLGLVVGGTALLSGRGRRPWILLASGIGLNVVGDTFNLFSNSIGSSHLGVVFNAIAWPTAIVVMSMAVWLRQRPSNPLAPQKSAGFLLPELGAAAALVILFVGTLRSVGGVAIGLATATLLMVGIRLVLSVRGLQKLSQERHRQSVTDDLTGLGNRRHLFRVLDSFFADGDGRRRIATLPSCSSTSTTSRRSTTPSATRPVTSSSSSWASGSPRSLRNSDLLVRLGGDEFAVVLIDGDADYAATVAERLTAEPRGALRPRRRQRPHQRQHRHRHGADRRHRQRRARVVRRRGDVPRQVGQLGRSRSTSRTSTRTATRCASSRSCERRSTRATSCCTTSRSSTCAPGRSSPSRRWSAGSTPGSACSRRSSSSRSPKRPVSCEQLTKWVLDEAVAQCAAWRPTGRQMVVSVNVSPTNLLEPGFTDIVRDQLQRHNLPAGALVLEITETCMISEFERSRQVIEDLRDLGVIVSIDDFGAGVTSLAYLSSLAVGELKLDRSFIVGLAAGGVRDLDLVRSTIELGHAMGLRIVAEGIEDGDTLRLLTDLGCDVAQGYCISRPKPAVELAFRSEEESAAEFSATTEPEAARV